MTKVAAIKLTSLGIRANSVHPGFVDTPILHGGAGQEVRDRITATVEPLIPQGRLARPEELTEMVLFLASRRVELLQRRRVRGRRRHARRSQPVRRLNAKVLHRSPWRADTRRHRVDPDLVGDRKRSWAVLRSDESLASFQVLSAITSMTVVAASRLIAVRGIDNWTTGDSLAPLGAVFIALAYVGARVRATYFLAGLRCRRHMSPTTARTAR